MNQRLTRITGLAMLTLTLATLAAPTAQAAAATTHSPEEPVQTATGAQSRFHPEIPGFDITLPAVHATPDSQLNHPGTLITLPEVSAITPPVIAGQPDFHPEVPGTTITLPEVTAPEQSTDTESTNQSNPSDQTPHHTTQPDQPSTPSTGTHATPEQPAVPAPTTPNNPDFHPEIPGTSITLPEVTAPNQPTDNGSTNQPNPSDQTAHHTAQPDHPSIPSIDTHVTPEQPTVPAPTAPDKPGNITGPDVTTPVTPDNPQTKPVAPTPQPDASGSLDKPVTGPSHLVPTIPSKKPGHPGITNPTIPISPQTPPATPFPLLPAGTIVLPDPNSKVIMIDSHQVTTAPLVKIKKNAKWYTDSTLQTASPIKKHDFKVTYTVTQQADLKIDGYPTTYVKVTRTDQTVFGKTVFGKTHTITRWLPIQYVTDVK